MPRKNPAATELRIEIVAGEHRVRREWLIEVRIVSRVTATPVSPLAGELAKVVSSVPTFSNPEETIRTGKVQHSGEDLAIQCDCFAGRKPRNGCLQSALLLKHEPLSSV
jgi:hypothetical protein